MDSEDRTLLTQAAVVVSATMIGVFGVALTAGLAIRIFTWAGGF